MKTYFYFLFSILFFVNTSTFKAQDSKLVLYLKEKANLVKETPWIVGLSGNVIDDDGKPFQNVFDTKKVWNVRPFPTKVTCEKTFLNGWSSEFSFAYNYIKKGKVINGDVRTSTGNYLCFDLAAKYNFNQFFPKYNYIDLYAISGLGYTHRDASKYNSVMTANLGVGTTVWVYNDLLGLNIQSIAKFGLASPIFKTGANYLQHSVGIVFKFDNHISNTLTRIFYTKQHKFFKARQPED